MKKTKKIISLLLSFLMIITSIPLMAINSFAAYDDELYYEVITSGDYEYGVLDDGIAEITDYTGSATELTIPSEIDGYKVTSIGYYAFYDCSSLTSIIIPDSVTSIGKRAFYDCGSLTSITIPDSVTSIGQDAFYDTAYYNNESNWNNGMLYIGNHLIEAKSDISGSIKIKQGTKTIADEAFRYCESLASVTIGNSVTSIGDWAFGYCESLTSITIPDSVTRIGNYAFVGCKSLTSITIGNNVTSMGYEAFWYCTSLASITIPDSVTCIGSSTFDDTAYYNDESNWDNGILYIGNHLIDAKEDISGSVEIKQGTKTIAGGAFWGRKSLTSITIPDSVVTGIKNNIFYTCTSLTEINVDSRNANCSSENGVLFNQDKTEIVCYPAGKTDTSYSIPDGVTSIGESAFEHCKSLTNITIPDSVISIGRRAFYECESLTNITIPDSVTSIGDYVFEGTAYYNDESNWDNGILYVGNHLIDAKEDISGSLEIRQGTKTIADFAIFNDYDLLKSVTIPVTVKTIGEYALGYVDKSGKYFGASKIEGFTIYGVSGSEAERYANENGFAFEEKLFPDVSEDAWYYPAIAFNVNKGYLKGYGNGTFGPADNIQRQDFVVLLSRIAGADLSAYEGQNGGFADVPKNDYYSAAVAWAKDNNILSGYANGKFGVGDPITREQACKIFYNYCDGSVEGDTSAILANYPDGGNVSDWAREYVAWAAENRVVGGNGTLNPAGNANRAEMAQIIMNMSNNDIL